MALIAPCVRFFAEQLCVSSPSQTTAVCRLPCFGSSLRCALQRDRAFIRPATSFRCACEQDNLQLQTLWIQSFELCVLNCQQEVIRKAPRFRGMQQQDSHELFHYLIDGVNDEELKRLKLTPKPRPAPDEEEGEGDAAEAEDGAATDEKDKKDEEEMKNEQDEVKKEQDEIKEKKEKEPKMPEEQTEKQPSAAKEPEKERKTDEAMLAVVAPTIPVSTPKDGDTSKPKAVVGEQVAEKSIEVKSDASAASVEKDAKKEEPKTGPPPASPHVATNTEVCTSSF